MTIIVLLVLMMGPYATARFLLAVLHVRLDPARAAVFGLALLFAFTGVGHFVQTEPMVQMLPPWVPTRTLLVYATGFLEFAIAAGFLFRKTIYPAGWIAAIALILFFPANIYAAIRHVPMGGHADGPMYLLIRAPLQAIILFWVYGFTLKPLRHS